VTCITPELTKEWNTCGPVYAKDWVIPRVEIFKKFLKYLDGKNVLEIGSNAGVFAYEIAKVANTYIGIEKEEAFYRQAMITAKHMKSDNHRFINGDIFSETLNSDINAFVGLFVLYHLSDLEVDALRLHILPLCEVVVIQLRLEKRKTKKNSYGFERPENTIRFLKDLGFKIKKCSVQPVKEQFVTIVAKAA